MEHKPYTQEELSGLCLGLHHLIHAGLRVGDALSLLAEDEDRPDRRDLLLQMADQADFGGYLSDILKETGLFPAYTVAMTAAGEETGRLEEALAALAAYYENRARLERQLRTALFQPMALVGVLLTVIVALLGWVLPVFDDVYRQLGAGLTGFAGSLLAFGRVLRRSAPFFALAAAAGGFYAYQKLQARQDLFAHADEAWLAQVLALALRSGLTNDRALELAADLGADGSDFKARCLAALDDLQGMETLPKALANHGLMPRADCRLLDAGLRAGCGDTVMEELAKKALERSETAIARRLSRIEPALVMGAALLVGIILLTVLLPLTRIMAAIG